MKIKMNGVSYRVVNVRRFVSMLSLLISLTALTVISTVTILKAEDSDTQQPKVLVVEKEKVVTVEKIPEGGYVKIKGILPWYSNLEMNAKRFGVDPRLMVAVYAVESEFYPRCVNPASGCRGLGQISYETYKDINAQLKDDITWAQMKEPWANIKYTTFAMAQKIKSAKSLRRGIHAYGGCIAYNNKKTYERKVANSLKNIYGLELEDIKIGG